MASGRFELGMYQFELFAREKRKVIPVRVRCTRPALKRALLKGILSFLSVSQQTFPRSHEAVPIVPFLECLSRSNLFRDSRRGVSGLDTHTHIYIYIIIHT